MLNLVSAPVAEPLTATEVRQRLDLGSVPADAVLDAMVKASRQLIDGGDGWLGRALITQTWDLVLDAFGDLIRIPLAPLQTIVSVKHLDPEGVEQTVPVDTYRVIPGTPALLTLAPGKLWPRTWCGFATVTIRFRAGYGDTGSTVPEPIRNAIVLGVAGLRALTERNLFTAREKVEGVDEVQYIVSEAAGRALTAAQEALLAPYRVFA